MILMPQPGIAGMRKHAWLATSSLVINCKVSYSGQRNYLQTDIFFFFFLEVRDTVLFIAKVLKNKNNKNHLPCVCPCMCSSEGNLCELVLYIHHMGPGTELRFSGLVLSHHSGSKARILKLSFL